MFQVLRNVNKKSGFLLIEILLATAIVGIVFITLLGIGLSAMNVSSSIKKETQADSLTKEGLEATRSFRDSTTWSTNGLGTIATGSGNSYHLVSASNNWTMVQGAETTGIFTRQIVVDRVSRDPSTKNIESSYNAANDDPDTRKVTVTVSWQGKTLQVVSYFTNWK